MDLRHVNVFGSRQDPDGGYASVIPKRIGAMIRGDEIFINGDGSTSRDFRAGDVRHSQADVSKARRLLGYEPRVTMKEGVALAMPWYLQRLG